jgi:heat shock protein HslJ
MSTSKIRNVFLSGLFVVMVACSPAGPEDESEMVAEILPLEGTNWQLVELTVLGGFVFVPDDHSKYVLNFRSGNRLTGTSDCNSIAGSWQQDDTALRFEPYSSTRSLCAPGSLHSYLDLYLKDVEALSFRDGLMVLTTPTEGVEIKFESRE